MTSPLIIGTIHISLQFPSCNQRPILSRRTLGATNHPVCPVASILPYLALRGGHPGPLLLTKKGHGLIHQPSVDAVFTNNHANSFHIGAATSAAQTDIPDRFIKMLGHWKSDVYWQYNM